MITTKENVENYLLIDIDPSFDDQITEWIMAIEKYIANVTDRKIIADTIDTDYKYDGKGKDSLVIDDFISIASVQIGEDPDNLTDVTTDVRYYPSNKVPFTKLVRPYGIFEKGYQNVIVSGKQGFCSGDAIPEDLVLAATVLVAGIINYSNSSQGEVQSETIGRYSVTYNKDSQIQDYKNAKETVLGYKRFRY